jgi:hypothetical protein
VHRPTFWSSRRREGKNELRGRGYIFKEDIYTAFVFVFFAEGIFGFLLFLMNVSK